MGNKNIDLVALAKSTMRERGFDPEFSAQIDAQVKALPSAEHFTEIHRSWKDYRHLLWTSIDNDDSKDLDQVEVAERLSEDRTRILVGIAYVDRCAGKDSPMDQHAKQNTTSVYTGVITFPMLPDALSTDRTSLNEGQDREAMIVDMIVSSEGDVIESSVSLGLVKNHAQLSYDEVSSVLDGHPSKQLPFQNALIMEQLRLQDETAQRLRKRRQERGALELETIEARPLMLDGQVKDLQVLAKNRARELIEDFMIAANSVIARFFTERKLPHIRRVIRVPKRWPRIVALAATYGTKLPDVPNSLALAQFLIVQRKKDKDRFPDLSLAVIKLLGVGEYVVFESNEQFGGHFSLAVQDYTHFTAPNRRFPDLITQRLLVSCLEKRPAAYDQNELLFLAQRCTTMTNEAQKVERLMRKAAAALLLQKRMGEVFDAIVTGSSEKGTYVRLFHPAAEGRVVKNEQGMDVGDRVQVKLIRVVPEQGFIDFAGM